MPRAPLVVAVVLAACAAPPAPAPPAARPPAPPSPAVGADAFPPAAPAAEPDAAPDAGAKADAISAEPVPEAGWREIRFTWKPARGPAAAYVMVDPADQHLIALPPGLEPGAEVPVVVGFHGQPARGKDPRDYWFPGAVRVLAEGWVKEGRLRPFALVLPVFRFVGSNWPGFDTKAFRAEVERLLGEAGVRAGGWYAFGHSGAAGCGGDGLNAAYRMKPAAVGFFDTCVGPGFVSVVGELERRRTPTLVVHSVETAGYSPRQRPEYQSRFDFGLVYEPAGLAPIPCPDRHPGERLRPQKWKCAASPGGLVRAFVIDTGEGAEAHQAVVEPALRFFLEEVGGLRKAD